MTEYEIKLSKGHVLIHDGEGWLLVDMIVNGLPARLVLDTGTPTSFAGREFMKKAGHRRRERLGRMTISRLSVRNSGSVRIYPGNTTN